MSCFVAFHYRSYGTFFLHKKGSIISIGDLPTTNIIEPEMRERVGGRVDLFFMSSEKRKRIKTLSGLFSRDSFFLTLACYNGNRKSKGG